ncbi:MAG: alpha/beta fold hydrolase, partial [Spirochaetota bacterium]
MRKAAILVISILAFVAPGGAEGPRVPPPGLREKFLSLAEGLPAFPEGLAWESPSVAGADAEKLEPWLSYYRYDPKVRMVYGSFSDSRAPERRLFGLAALPPDPRGTVIFLHGYLEHLGGNLDVLRELASRGYAVAGFDLPGHGLSEGLRGDIGDFSEYASALETFVSICEDNFPKPFHFVGHSTGCAVFLEYAARTGATPAFRQAIFVAPLVRSRMWQLSHLGLALLPPFVRSLPRWYRPVSSNEDYLRFVRFGDPLEDRTIAPGWARALFRWNDRLGGYPVIRRPLTIVQGSDDSVVEFESNLPF